MRFVWGKSPRQCGVRLSRDRSMVTYWKGESAWRSNRFDVCPVGDGKVWFGEKYLWKLQPDPCFGSGCGSGFFGRGCAVTLGFASAHPNLPG